jgi:hypothetical protein
MKKVLLTCLGLLLVSPIFAQFSLEQVLSSAFPSELKASPVKNQIAWVFNQTGSRNIFLAEAPDFKPRKLTNYEGDNGQEINSITFYPMVNLYYLFEVSITALVKSPILPNFKAL